MTSKQRAYLRGLANSIEPIFQIGKGGISDCFAQQIADALKARELIKISVLESAPESTKDLAIALAEKTDSIVVQTVGRKITLYKRNSEKPRIVLE